MAAAMAMVRARLAELEDENRSLRASLTGLRARLGYDHDATPEEDRAKLMRTVFPDRAPDGVAAGAEAPALQLLRLLSTWKLDGFVERLIPLVCDPEKYANILAVNCRELLWHAVCAGCSWDASQELEGFNEIAGAPLRWESDYSEDSWARYRDANAILDLGAPLPREVLDAAVRALGDSGDDDDDDDDAEAGSTYSEPWAPCTLVTLFHTAHSAQRLSQFMRDLDANGLRGLARLLFSDERHTDGGDLCALLDVAQECGRGAELLESMDLRALLFDQEWSTRTERDCERHMDWESLCASLRRCGARLAFTDLEQDGFTPADLDRLKGKISHFAADDPDSDDGDRIKAFKLQIAQSRERVDSLQAWMQEERRHRARDLCLVLSSPQDLGEGRRGRSLTPRTASLVASYVLAEPATASVPAGHRA